MSYFKGALEEDYKKVGKLYHGRKHKRNLFLVNSAFVICLIIAIILPIKWYYTMVLCFILLVAYGIARLCSLND